VELFAAVSGAPIRWPRGRRWIGIAGRLPQVWGGCNGTGIDGCRAAISTYRPRPSKPQALALAQRLLLYLRFVLSLLRFCGDTLPICIRIVAQMSPLPANRDDTFLHSATSPDKLRHGTYV
jgi:hypothetical protein